ncbi:MAG: hypothetical protein ACKN89_11565 [Cyanobium sp.]|jgi:hypothetical protein|nr:hypothetical protein [Synechococcaceae cyanobacterium]
MKPLRGIPSSQAYWELKAEQMMNRIFDEEPIIDLEPRSIGSGTAAFPPHTDQPRGPAARPRPSARPARRAGATPRRAPLLSRFSALVAQDHQLLLVASLAGLSLVGALCSALFLNHSWKVQENLREERNLLLVERLRSLGPATAAQPVLAQPLPAPQATAGVDLPPPPPADETWMQELGNLPRSSSDQAPVLRVPLSPRLAATAPPASRAARDDSGSPPGPAPQLVGVVAAQGRPGAAIFQVGNSVSNVAVGDAIGPSGWRLQSADGDTAVIERHGEVRRLSLTTAP